MDTSRPWNRRLTVPTTTKMALVRPAMTDFKTTVRADCAVSAWSPSLVCKRSCPLMVSGGNWLLDRRPPFHAPPLAGIWSKANFLSTDPTSLLASETTSRVTPLLVTGLRDHMVALFLIFWGTSILFPRWLYQFTFSPAVCKSSNLSTPSSALMLSVYFITAVETDTRQRRMVTLIGVVLTMSDAEGLFLHLWASCMLSLEKCLLRAFAHFLNWVVWFFCS